MIRVIKPEGFGNIQLEEVPIPDIENRQVSGANAHHADQSRFRAIPPLHSRGCGFPRRSWDTPLPAPLKKSVAMSRNTT